MGRTLLRILKIICYVALGALLAGFAALAFLGVLDGEALVKVPSAAKSKRPLPRL